MTGTERSAMVRDLERLARAELSLRARVGHVLLALVASAMTVGVVSLWVTEPGLPVRTHVAFGVLSVIGGAWTAYSVWVLRARRVMLAHQRVVAGRMAVVFTGVFAAGCLALALTTGVAAAWPAFLMGLVLLTVALVLWRRAEATRAALLARREVLARQLQENAR